MAEKNVNEMPSGQNDEKILVLEEMPGKGKAVGRTTVLTDGVRDEILSRLEERTERTTLWSFPSMAAYLPNQKEKAMIPNVTQRDNPLTAFMSKLIVYFDAMDTEGDLKSIYVVSANIYRLNSISDCRIDSFPKLIRLSRTMSFSVQKLREEERLINDGMMTDSTKIDWKKLENDFGVKADWLTRKGQVDTPLHIQQSDAVKAARPLIGKYNDQWLRTEYNTAILRARSAVQYRDALRTKALYPSLEYLESDSVEKREEHLALVGTIRPIEDPWWDTHTPPLAWNCKCRIRPTDKPVTPIPEETAKDKPAPGLSGNPSRSGSVFDLKSHPYTRGQGDPHCPECRRQGLVKSSDLLDYKDLLCPMHREAWEALEGKRKEQQKLADKWVKEWAVKNIPEKHGIEVKGRKLYTGCAVVSRQSVKALLGHIADPEMKLLVKNIEMILEACTPKEGNTFAPLYSQGHNRKAKLKRRAIGYAYYRFEWEGEEYHLDSEVRKDGEVMYESPYAMRKIKKNL